jgi:hypothetical protein
MGLFWCRAIPEPQPTQPFRISDLGEEELVRHKLQYLKNVLVEQKEKYLQNENREIGLAKELRKTNVSEAKYHIQKAKICRAMKSRIVDRIFLVTRQIHNLESTQEDLQFANTLQSSNELLSKLTKEINSKALLQAMEVIESTEDRSKELQELMVMYNAHPDQDLNREFEALTGPTLPVQTPLHATLNSVADLERKEVAFN